MKERRILTPKEIINSELFLQRQLEKERTESGLPVLPIEEWKQAVDIYARTSAKAAAEKQREELK